MPKWAEWPSATRPSNTPPEFEMKSSAQPNAPIVVSLGAKPIELKGADTQFAIAHRNAKNAIGIASRFDDDLVRIDLENCNDLLLEIARNKLRAAGESKSMRLRPCVFA